MTRIIAGIGILIAVISWLQADATYLPDLVPYEDITTWPGVTMIDGLPYVSYSGGVLQVNPATIALFGIMASTRLYDPTIRVNFRKASEWLLDNQQADGSYRYQFRYVDPILGVDLEPGWASAIAQGLAISMLVRAFEYTGDPRFLESARRAVSILEIPVESGGLQRRLNGMIFFEEYPDPDLPNYVLNGHLFTVNALYELANISGDPHIQSLAQQGAATGATALELYALPGNRSRYALSTTIQASRNYQRIHIRLCVILYKHSGLTEYAAMADRWSRDWRILKP